MTLVELMVAVAALALLSAIAYGALQAMAGAAAERSRSRDALNEVQWALTRLQRELEQVVAAAPGNALPMQGSATQLRFTTQVRRGMENEGSLVEVEYVVDQGTLLRIAERDPGNATTMMQDINAFSWSYYEPGRGWRADWGATGVALPTAIRLQWAAEDIGQIERVVALPMVLR